jgi:hypothetical protein
MQAIYGVKVAQKSCSSPSRQMRRPTQDACSLISTTFRMMARLGGKFW